MRKILRQPSDRSERQDEFAVVALSSELAFPPLVVGLQDIGVGVGRSLLPVRITGKQWIEQYAADEENHKKKKNGLLDNSSNMISSMENCVHSLPLG
jgi:hypothetical protein